MNSTGKVSFSAFTICYLPRQVKDEHCRQLEAALDGLDHELNKISRSRHELSILRLEEVEEDDGLSVTKDGALLTHLDNRLGHLEREQLTLEEERTSLQVRRTTEGRKEGRKEGRNPNKNTMSKHFILSPTELLVSRESGTARNDRDIAEEDGGFNWQQSRQSKRGRTTNDAAVNLQTRTLDTYARCPFRPPRATSE